MIFIGYIPTPEQPINNQPEVSDRYLESELALQEIRAHGETIGEFLKQRGRLRTPEKRVNFFDLEDASREGK